MTVTEETRPKLVALVGNPNVGKSTLFNALTGMRQRVANYPGVTVDAREGTIESDDGEPTRVLDLPGTYSLRPSANDEAIVERVFLGEVNSPDAALVVLDATNLRRNLFLLTEVIDLGKPLVIALNMVDEARRGGLEVPTERLADLLGVPVVETVASRGEGADALRAALDDAKPASRLWRFEDAALEERLEAAAGETTWGKLAALHVDLPDLREQEVLARYTWINQALQAPEAAAAGDVDPRERTERLDRYLLHPFFGPVIFLAVMGFVFQSIFTWAEPVMGLIEVAFTALGEGTQAVMPGLFGSLLADGIISGVGSVVVFLPQIIILFFFIGLLEDTGYMGRAAFLIDRPLRAVGLSGRSFIPLLSSFACAVPGVMATRTIPNKFERLLAIAVAPLMTCSARLPVYTLLIAAFVPAKTVAGFLNLQGLVMLSLYLAGLGAGVVLAFCASRRKRKGRVLPMVVELPPYRRPTLRGVLLKLRIRAGDFLKRAGTVIFAVSVVLWILMTFPRAEPQPGLSDHQQAAYQLENSYAGSLGHAIEPAIRPLGYDWKIGVGVIASFAAREVFVGTMGVVYSIQEDEDAPDENKGLRAALQREVDPKTGKKVFSLATVFSLLAFYVFALQCGATVAVVKRETRSWRFAAVQLFGYLALAYLSALITYQGMSALGYG